MPTGPGLNPAGQAKAAGQHRHREWTGCRHREVPLQRREARRRDAGTADRPVRLQVEHGNFTFYRI